MNEQITDILIDTFEKANLIYLLEDDELLTTLAVYTAKIIELTGKETARNVLGKLI